MKYIAFILAFLLFAMAVHAENPMQKMKETTEKVLLLLDNPRMQGESNKDERRRLVRSEIEKRFAWDQICRNCLGRHWAALSPAGKAEFGKLFSDFLKDNYSYEIAAYYNSLDKVDYRGEQIIDNYWASVKLVLTTKAKSEFSIECIVEKSASGGEWKIYDVVIEGVSLVKIYRDRLDAIITESSYEELLESIHPS